MSEPTDIARLFATDPLQLSERDLDAIVMDLRQRRAQFNAGNMAAGKVKTKPLSLKQSLQASLDLEVKL